MEHRACQRDKPDPGTAGLELRAVQRDKPDPGTARLERRAFHGDSLVHGTHQIGDFACDPVELDHRAFQRTYPSEGIGARYAWAVPNVRKGSRR